MSDPMKVVGWAAQQERRDGSREDGADFSEALRDLAQAVLWQAVRDVLGIGLYHKDTNPVMIQAEAMDWLTGADAAMFAEIAGWEPEAPRQWVEHGCPVRDEKLLEKIRSQRWGKRQEPKLEAPIVWNCHRDF